MCALFSFKNGFKSQILVLVGTKNCYRGTKCGIENCYLEQSMALKTVTGNKVWHWKLLLGIKRGIPNFYPEHESIKQQYPNLLSPAQIGGLIFCP